MTGLALRIGLSTVMLVVLAACADESSDSDQVRNSESSPSGSPDLVSLPDTEMTEADSAAVDDAVAAADALSVSPAYWIGVYDPEKGYYEQAYGKAEVDGVNAAIDQSFRIGSISKTFTATLILQLVDEGELDLDETVAEATPEIAQRFPVAADVTLRELLNMQSGIQDYMNVPDSIVAQTAKDPSTVYDADTLIQAGIDAGRAALGTYSTTNFLILQEIAESVTGESIQDLISERITEPLGMTVAAMPPDDDTTLPDPGTHGYLNAGCVKELKSDGAIGPFKDGTDTTDWNASYGQGGGGMHSNIRDLGIWSLAGSGNALLSDDLVTERLETKTLTDGIAYGLGILQVGDWIGHEGEALGWEALSFYNPETKVGVAFGTNACNGNFGEFVKIIDTLYPNTGLSS